MQNPLAVLSLTLLIMHAGCSDLGEMPPPGRNDEVLAQIAGPWVLGDGYRITIREDYTFVDSSFGIMSDQRWYLFSVGEGRFTIEGGFLHFFDKSYTLFKHPETQIIGGIVAYENYFLYTIMASQLTLRLVDILHSENDITSGLHGAWAMTKQAYQKDGEEVIYDGRVLFRYVFNEGTEYLYERTYLDEPPLPQVSEMKWYSYSAPLLTITNQGPTIAVSFQGSQMYWDYIYSTMNLTRPLTGQGDSP